MKTEIEITKYNEPKAKGLFALFKALELFGVFLLTFGFYGLGSLVCKHFPKGYTFAGEPLCGGSYFEIWVAGLMIFLIICILLICVGTIGLVIYLLIKKWIKGNWNLAKRFAEDPKDKEKRLKQQEVKEKKEQRLKFGYCVGDEAKYIYKGGDTSNHPRLGQKCKILKIGENGNIYPQWEDGTEGSLSPDYMNVAFSSFKLTKKQKLN